MSQFIEVIENLDATGDTIVARYPAEGSGEIKFGAQLIVRESQAAIFFRDGKAMDSFGPGRYTLTTANIPLIAIEAEEIAEMFRQCGAGEIEIFGGYKGQAYKRLESVDIVVTALKGDLVAGPGGEAP